MNTDGKYMRRIQVILLLLAGIVLISGVSATEFAPWSVQTVDSGGKVGEYSSVALDAAGNPAMSYYDQTYGDLKYASWDGSKWVITTVDVSKSESPRGWYFWNWWGHDRTQDREYIQCFHGTEKVGKYSSLAFDNTGKPRISFYDESKGDLKYASWDGSKWVVTTVSSAGHVGEYSSLAFDSNNNPRISFFDDSKDDLKYAAWSNNKWVISTVDSSGHVGEYSSLALDSNNNPRISYYDQSDSNLNYASLDGNTWVISTVDGTKNRNGPQKDSRYGYRDNWDYDRHRFDDQSRKVGKYSSLALDSNNNPRISYYDETNKILKYAAWNGTLWITSIVDSSKNSGEYSSLALDSNNNPRISYYDQKNNDLKFAAWSSANSRWVPETVDSSGKVGSFTSLALDSLGRPHISYYDQSHKDLKYARGSAQTQPPTLPTVTGISPASGPLSGGTVVTITGTGFTGATQVMFGTIAGTNLTVVDATHISITSPGGAAGTVDITVITPAGTSAVTSSDQFTYTVVLPTVTGISPASGPLSGGTVVTITGTGFTGATQVMFGTIAGTNLTVVDATHISITSPAGAAGTVDITVITPTGTSVTSPADQFTYNAVPTVTALTPSTGSAGTSVVTNVSGTGFLPGATVTLTKSGSPDIIATPVTVDSSTKITCTLPLPAASLTSAGQWTVVVTNSDGQSVTLANAFTVTNPAPVITAITPARGVSGSPESDVSITGANFIAGTTPTVRLVKTNEVAVTATDVVVVSPTQVTCKFPTLPGLATSAGTWDVVIINQDTQSGTLTGGFLIEYPSPTVISVTPPSGVAGTTLSIEISGTNFNFGPNPHIWLEKTGEANITATDTHVFNPDTITCSLNIPETAAIGDYSIMVMNPDGKTASKIGAFGITAPAPASQTWIWSSEGWTGWQSSASCPTGTGTCTQYGPDVVNGYGIQGTSVTMPDMSGSVKSSVWKAFTAPAGSKYSTLTFSGLLSPVDFPQTRSMTIKVNGDSVYSGNAESDSSLNGVQFTITRSFPSSNEVIVEIISMQDPNLGSDPTVYSTQFNSLTLSS